MSHIVKRAVICKDSASKYEWKLLKLKKSIIEYVHENAALCDELTEVQEQLIIRNEERKYLLRKLCQYEPQVEQEVEKLSNTLYNNPTNENNKNDSSNSTKKSVKRKPSTTADGTVNASGVSTQNSTKSTVNSANNNKVKRPILKPRKKVIQPMVLDTFGRPIFPIELGSLTIHYLGEVMSEHEYHTEDVIYPVGFVSTKLYGSVQDPTLNCIYTCKISDNNGHPSFEISSDENTPSIFGATPDVCHSMLLQKLNDVLNMNVVSTKPRGNDFFGLSHPTVLHLVQGSPKARKCANYRWTKFEIAKYNEPPIEEVDASLNFDMLQRSINYCKFKMAPSVLERQEEYMDNNCSKNSMEYYM